MDTEYRKANQSEGDAVSDTDAFFVNDMRKRYEARIAELEGENERLRRVIGAAVEDSANLEGLQHALVRANQRYTRAEAELAALRAQHHYPHMCRDGHPEIGHSTDNERCPVCLMRDERDARYPS